MLTRDAIRNLAQDVPYKKGLQLYYSKNRLQNFKVDERRLTGLKTGQAYNIVTCLVRDGGAELNRVRVEYDPRQERLVSAACDCLAFANNREICRHCVAVLLKYGDWQVKQGLYVRPEGSFEKVQSGEKPASMAENTFGVKGEAGSLQTSAKSMANASAIQQTAPDVLLAPAEGKTAAAPEAGLQLIPVQESQPEAYIPKEPTSTDMKVLLMKQARMRTAPVTEQMVYGRIRIEPILHLGLNGDKVEFRIGADRTYVMKNTLEFCGLMETGEDFRYGKNLVFTHTMEALRPESRPLARFIADWSQRPAEVRPYDLRAADDSAGGFSLENGQTSGNRFIHLNRQALEELLDLTWDTGIAVVQDMGFGRTSREGFWQAADGWPDPVLSLTGEYTVGQNSRNAAEGSDIQSSRRLDGVRGSAEVRFLRACPGYVYTFQDGFMYRIPRRSVDHIAEWLETLSPKPLRWDSEKMRAFVMGHGSSETDSETETRTFFIARQDLPAFCRELLPQMKKVFKIERQDFDEDDFEMAQAAFHFYLDSPKKDMVTCRALASYNGREYALYRGVQMDRARGTGLADRDLLAELSVWQALGNWLPAESATAGVSERILAGDEEGLYRLLTEGIAALQNLGTVYVSDALKRISVRPAPKVKLGVSLSGDLLNLSVDAEGLGREELAEILSRYDRRKKYTRLKNGEFVQMDGDEIQALAEMQEAMGFSAKDLKSGGELELPRFRAMYLDKQMREGALDGIPIERSREFKALVRNMRTVEDSDYEVPESLRDIMRGYQKQGFLWLKTLAASGFGGILADDMGLGKTLQVISFLLSEHEEGISESGRKLAPTLIVCPASLVYNWESEIQKFAPQLETKLIVGTAAERQILLGEVAAACDSEKGTDAVCITSYELLRRDIEMYEGLRFGCQVIDEAQYIKNHGTKASKAVKEIRAAFKAALTGTPIENRLSELWSIFDYMMPGFLYGYEQFRSRFERPIVALGNQESMERLQRMIGPFVLRRLKKDVLRDLPEKIEENMLTRLEGEQRELYDAQVQEMRQFLAGQSEEEYNRSQMAVLAQLTRLRQICCDPGLIYEGYQGGASKVDMCMELIASAVEAGHKLLVFSQFTSMLEVLEQRLREAEIPWYKLEGATPKERRMEMVRNFNREDDKTPVFLISLKAGGTGLNLTAADVVIHFDPWWNLAVQNQATDRAHRIGQKQVVNVYKLIARDTIEEKIVALQERKRELADQVLAGGELGSGSFSREELLEILG